MIDLTPGTPSTATVDLARFRAVVPRYQWTEIAVRLWGQRPSDHAVPTTPSSSTAVQGSPSLTDS